MIGESQTSVTFLVHNYVLMVLMDDDLCLACIITTHHGFSLPNEQSSYVIHKKDKFMKSYT